MLLALVNEVGNDFDLVMRGVQILKSIGSLIANRRHTQDANLKNMVNENGEKLDPSHIYIAGIWTYGGSPVYLKRIFLSNDGETPASITGVELDNKEIVAAEYYTLDGRRLLQPQRGVNIIKTRLNNGKTKVLKMCYKP